MNGSVVKLSWTGWPERLDLLAESFADGDPLVVKGESHTETKGWIQTQKYLKIGGRVAPQITAGRI
jgi:hypothetical protein